MVGLHVLAVSLAALSTALAVPLNHDEQQPEIVSVAGPSADVINAIDNWFGPLDVQTQETVLTKRSTLDDDEDKEDKKVRKERKKERLRECKADYKRNGVEQCNKNYPIGRERKQCEENAELEYLNCINSVHKHYGRQAVGPLEIQTQETVLTKRSTQDDDEEKEDKKERKERKKERIRLCKEHLKERRDKTCSKKHEPNKKERKQCKADAKLEYLECMNKVHRNYGRQAVAFPGDGELLKDSAKAAAWFSQHCAAEMILAKFQGRKPHYDGLKEKVMCPLIAKTFPHLVPFDNPFDAFEMPGPVIGGVNGLENIGIADELD